MPRCRPPAKRKFSRRRRTVLWRPRPSGVGAWGAAEHGYYEILDGLLAPGLLVGESTDVDEQERLFSKRRYRLFRPWHNVLLPRSALPQFADYYLQTYHGTDGGDPPVVVGRPVVPPVFTLDGQVLRSGFAAETGTRMGYADVGRAWFFPWRGISVVLDELSPEARSGLFDLRQAFRRSLRGSDDRAVHSADLFVPPDRVGFVKGLPPSPPPAPLPQGEEPPVRGVRFGASVVGAEVSFAFGDEVLYKRK